MFPGPFLYFFFPPCGKEMEPALQTLTGKKFVDEKGYENAHAGVNHAVNSIANVVGRGVEENDAQDHASRLNAARPVEEDAQAYQYDHTDGNEKEPKPIIPAREKGVFQGVQTKPDKSANDGAEEAVSAVKTGLPHVAAHAEDGPDTGKGGITPGNKGIEQSGKKAGEGGFQASESETWDGSVNRSMILHEGSSFLAENGHLAFLSYHIHQCMKSGQFDKIRALLPGLVWADWP